jgi:hypothetical protein
MRAAKLSWVPGVTIADACTRFGVTRTAINRARKIAETKPSLGELVLAALTDNGTQTAGMVSELERVRGWVSYLDKAEYSVDEVRGMLAPLVDAGVISLGPARWRLLRDWP